MYSIFDPTPTSQKKGVGNMSVATLKLLSPGDEAPLMLLSSNLIVLNVSVSV